MFPRRILSSPFLLLLRTPMVPPSSRIHLSTSSYASSSSSSSQPLSSSSSSQSTATTPTGTTNDSPSEAEAQPKPTALPVPPAALEPESPPYDVNHFTPFKKETKFSFSEMNLTRMREEKLQRERVAVNMFINEGRMPGEIAKDMEITVGTVRTYFLSQSRLSKDIYHSISHNWERASHEPGTYNFLDCKTIDAAFEKLDGFAAMKEREKNRRK